MILNPNHKLYGYVTPEFLKCIDVIVSTLLPERIYLLGVKQLDETTTSIYLPSPVKSQLQSRFHVCVIGSNDESQSTHNHQEKIETLCKDISPLLAWYISGADFLKSDENHLYFQYKIAKDGLLCYSLSLNAIESLEPITFQEVNHDIWFSRSSEFLASAELFIIRKNYKMCAFMLHQALEQIYIGITLSRTGMRTKSHNLERLQRYSDFILDDAIKCFPRNTDQEERLFISLKNAYTGSRYSESFSITGNDCRTLFDRISKVHETYKSHVPAKSF